MGVPALDVLSRRSKAYRSRAAEIDELSEDELIDAMVAEPTLLRRPLIVTDQQAVVGYDRDRLSEISAG
jgi:arsenate reductase-like glutaredoxin family protein